MVAWHWRPENGKRKTATSNKWKMLFALKIAVGCW